MSEEIRCGNCGKIIQKGEFKVTSLIQKDKQVCEDCAIEEDRTWLEKTVNLSI